MPSPSPTPAPLLPFPSGLPDGSINLPPVCQQSHSLACTAVWDGTHNVALAHAASWLIGRPLTIVGLILIAAIVRWITNRVTDRLVLRASAGVLPRRLSGMSTPQEGGAPNSTRRIQRAKTLGSLMKSLTAVLIYGITFVMILAQLGVNIAPILASAGVIGVAVGFGAQSLVKDCFAGISMMLEDQYGVGDSIKLADISGTVEAVGIRVTRLRDVDGTVWYVRNGEILKVGNQSQNWARSVLDIPVGLRSDLRQVRTVMGDVAHELAVDEAFRDAIIEDPEVWGVQSMSAEGLIVRVSLKTVPGQQWRVARELRERIKTAFDEANIEMPGSPV